MRLAADGERQQEGGGRRRGKAKLSERARRQAARRAGLSGCEQRGGGGRTDRPRRAELGVGDDDAVALGQAEAGGHLVAGERVRGGERGVADVGATGCGHEIGAGGAQDPFARDGALLLSHQTGHAGHHEGEQDDRRDVDHEAVVALVDDLQQGHDRGDQATRR